MLHLRLKELFVCDYETGILTRRIAASNVPAGTVAGYTSARGYRKVKVDGRSMFVHRVVWMMYHDTTIFSETGIDHKHGRAAGDGINNLRLANQSQNGANRAMCKNNKTGFKGVNRLPSGRYAATLRKNNRKLHLGVRDTAQEAAELYLLHSNVIHGEFSIGNRDV